MPVELQRWAPTDRDDVIAFVLGIQRDEFGVPITAADQPDLGDVPAHYGAGRGGFWVARDARGVAGTVGLLDHGGDAAVLRKMFVRADARGRAQGVSERLIDVVLSHARNAGLRVLRLGTRPEMRAAHRFYERHGFRRIDEAELPASFPRMRVDSVFYRLDLA